MAIFCCWGKTRAKSGIDGNICGAAIVISNCQIMGEQWTLSLNMDSKETQSSIHDSSSFIYSLAFTHSLGTRVIKRH